MGDCSPSLVPSKQQLAFQKFVSKDIVVSFPENAKHFDIVFTFYFHKVSLTILSKYSLVDGLIHGV